MSPMERFSSGDRATIPDLRVHGPLHGETTRSHTDRFIARTGDPQFRRTLAAGVRVYLHRQVIVRRTMREFEQWLANRG